MKSPVRAPFASSAGPLTNRFFQFLRVALERLLVLKRHLQELEKRLLLSDNGLRKTIVDAVSITTIENETGVLEVLQVTRHIWLGGIEDILDVTAAELSMQEEVQHAKSIDIRKPFEVFL